MDSPSHVIKYVVMLLITLGWPLAAQSQIASPSNAGQNSGNNTAASSSTSIGTPNFSQPLIVSLVSGVTVEQDGTLEGDPELLRRLERVIENEVSRSSLLSQAALDGGVPMLASASEQIITNGTGGSRFIFVRNNSLEVRIGGELIDLPTNPMNKDRLLRYVNEAIQADLTASSLKLGAQLVDLGTPVEPTVQLIAALQALVAQPSFDALARGISAFNVIVNGASPALRIQLENSEVFVSANNVLRTARNTLSSSR